MEVTKDFIPSHNIFSINLKQLKLMINAALLDAKHSIKKIEEKN